MVGRLFQVRFKAILVDCDAYLLAVSRYVERNPVAAGMVRTAADWLWSSYGAQICSVDAPPWLDTYGLHGCLLGRAPRSAADRRLAAARYADLVAEDSTPKVCDTGLRQQLYLRDEPFVERMLALANASKPTSRGVPKALRIAPLTLARCHGLHPGRATAMHSDYT